jgi:hypothetical protein
MQHDDSRPQVYDRGSHIEIALSARDLVQSSFVEILAAASKRFGPKPLLVICDDPTETIDMTQAYRIGVELSTELPLRRIAIALTGRKSSSANRFTELVAENRGAQVRYFESLEPARAWLVGG